MKTTVNFSQFCDAFSEDRKNTFTYFGKRALFDYLESYEDDTGEQVELDTVALCCEYTEYVSAQDAMREYQPEGMPVVDLQAYSDAHNGEGMDLVQVEEAAEQLALEWLRERTTVIETEDHRVIIQDF